MTSLQPTLGFEWRHKDDAWGTHQPVLYEAVKRSHGDVLELGSGFNSTPMIHALTENTDRKVLTVDHDANWLSKFLHLQTPNHEFRVLGSYEDIRQIQGVFSVVFIDEGNWESRAESLKYFADKATYLVLHDSDYIERQLEFKFAEHFAYFKTYMPLQPYPYETGPPTTLLSNIIDVRQWDINYEDYK
jgi:hypothetical protein